jgi:hypothetical protein
VSFDHKAFAFDWDAFQRELAPSLRAALASGDTNALERFLDENVDACSSPDEGEPLVGEWRNSLATGGVQEIADIALTKFYDPSEDSGLRETWAEIESDLTADARRALLGSAFEVRGVAFDPGKMGSYFQSPGEVRVSHSVLDALGSADLAEFVAFLAVVARESKGLYVTF